MKKELAEQKEAVKVCACCYYLLGGVRRIMSKAFRDQIENSCYCIFAGLISEASLSQC